MNCEIDIKQAVECLRKGGVILYPTDTVWGIGCDATNEEAVRRIYEIKQREDAKSMLCLVDKADEQNKAFVVDFLSVASAPFQKSCGKVAQNGVSVW